MSGVDVYRVPAPDGRAIHVVKGDLVMRLTPPEAELLRIRLGRRLGEVARSSGRMTEYQRRRLHALMRERGANGDARFPLLAAILGRPIGSTNDLTPEEADQAIERLQAARPS